MQGGVGRCGEAFRARGRAGMDVLRRLERRAHNLLAAVRLRAVTMACVEHCEVWNEQRLFYAPVSSTVKSKDSSTQHGASCTAGASYGAKLRGRTRQSLQGSELAKCVSRQYLQKEERD